jgi:serine/threonine-protein kinase
MNAPGTAAIFDVSDNGTLVSTPRGSGPFASTRTLAWVDRQGVEESIPIEEGGYAYPRISPDGTRALLDDRGPGDPVWIWDFALQTRARLTVGEGGRYPAWSRAGDRVAYLAPGGRMVWRSADGAGTPATILEWTEPSPYGFTEGDRAVLFVTPNGDIGLAPVEGSGGPTWLLDGTYSELNAEISPDGRWLAYQSDESGQFEIYVRPFSDVRSGQMQMSRAGGERPVWSRDGGELFYLEPGTSVPHLVSVRVAASGNGPLRVQSRQRLFEYPYLDAAPLGLRGRSYDVSLDGRRFLVLKDAETTEAGADVVLVLNWLEDLKRLLPAD